jgi:hypothetical protein
MRYLYFYCFGFFVFLTGCASNQLAVTYYSDPEGAVLYQNGVNFGYTPVTLYYTLSEEQLKRRGTMRLQELYARWASGASATANVTADLGKFGLHHTFMFKRPNVPGLDTDMRFALELARTRAAQRQAAAAEQQAAEAKRQADAAKRQADAAEWEARPKICNLYGNSVFCN